MKCKNHRCSNEVKILPKGSLTTQMVYCSRECAPYGNLSSPKKEFKEIGRKLGKSNLGRKKKTEELNSTPLWLLEWRMKKANE